MAASMAILQVASCTRNDQPGFALRLSGLLGEERTHLDVRKLLSFCDVIIDMRQLAELDADLDGVQAGLPVVLAGGAVVSRSYVALECLLQTRG